MAEFYKIAEHTLTNIADAMRMWTQKTDKVTPDEMPREVDAVFNAGADIGYTTGYNHGTSKGREEERQEFWSAAQDNGTLTAGTYLFCSPIWDDVTYKPEYDIKPVGSCISIYRYSRMTDMVAIHESQNIELDLSRATNLEYGFQSCLTKTLGVIDCTGLSASLVLRSTFNSMPNLETIALLKVTDKTQYNATFNGSTNLKNLTIEGTIGQNGFSVQQQTKMDKASLTSIVNAASTTASIPITLSSVAVKREFETSEGANDGNTSQEWKDLVATRPTVTFSLA